MLLLKPQTDINHQRGFVLLSVIFAAILVGIITLYQARITQAEVLANQVQLTAERAHLWLQAAMAYYNQNRKWPASLDFERYYAGTVVFDDKSEFSSSIPSFYISDDLVGSYFMPAAAENYAGSSETKAPIPQSASDTAWAVPDVGLPGNFLIVANAPSNASSCYTITSGLTESSYDQDCVTNPNQPFVIKIYVPSESIANQVAAKLPNSKVAHDATNSTRYIVYTSISHSSVQSSSDTVGNGSFIGGFIPFKQGNNTGLLSLDEDSNQEWNRYNNNLTLGFDENKKECGSNSYKGYLFGDTPCYVGDQVHTAYLYGTGGYSRKAYGSNSTAFLPFYTNGLRYNTSGDQISGYNKNTGDTSHYCIRPYDYEPDKHHSYTGNGNAPNFVVSTSGFSAPAILSHPFIEGKAGYHRYINSDYQEGAMSGSSSNMQFQYVGAAANCTQNDTHRYSNYECASFIPYSSLYGLIVMSFERHRDDEGRYGAFLIETMGMSNQARGNYEPNDYERGLQDFDVDLGYGTPTRGSFPGNGGSDGEFNNQDHFWAWPPSELSGQNVNFPRPDNQYESGIDGVNFFFFCNGTFQKS